MKDFLIIGRGLAGNCMALRLLSENKSIDVCASESIANSSLVASGMYNPIVLKRFTPVWNAVEQMDETKEFFLEYETKYSQKVFYPIGIDRVMPNNDEKEIWEYKAMDNDILKTFLNPTIKFDIPENVNAPYGVGEVLETGWVDMDVFLSYNKEFLISKDSYIDEVFDYQELQIEEDKVVYKGKEYKNVVFCEGYNMINNPFFKGFPLRGLKGETVRIVTEAKISDKIIKSKVFTVPQFKENEYYVGATYDRENVDTIPTDQGKETILKGLESMLKCDFKITNHYAGIRPTVEDRKPLVGQHPEYKNMYVLNGLGTRGVMLGVSMSKVLIDFILRGKEIPKEANINRYLWKK